MPDSRTHARVSKLVLGNLSLGRHFQSHVLDPSSPNPHHRLFDHTWERLEEVYRLYGEVGYAEFLIHLALDYGLIPEWNGRYKIVPEWERRKGRRR